MGLSPRATETTTIRAGVHGRFLVDEEWPGDHRNLLVGFHGYGENAEKHKEELDRLELEEWRIASVQALHPFYNQKTGEVLASWMTKLDRELAIADNIEYVKAVVEDIDRKGGRARRLVFAGFSQGVAMAYRAAAFAGHPCQGVIALAGDVPPDVKTEMDAGGALLPSVIVGRGDGDSWYTAEVMEQDLAFLRTVSPKVEAVVFAGGHEWTDAFRQGVRDFLRYVRGLPDSDGRAA